MFPANLLCWLLFKASREYRRKSSACGRHFSWRRESAGFATQKVASPSHQEGSSVGTPLGSLKSVKTAGLLGLACRVILLVAVEHCPHHGLLSFRASFSTKSKVWGTASTKRAIPIPLSKGNRKKPYLMPSSKQTRPTSDSQTVSSELILPHSSRF